MSAEDILDLVQIIEHLQTEIKNLKKEIEGLQEQLRVLDWKIDNPGGDYYD